MTQTQHERTGGARQALRVEEAQPKVRNRRFAWIGAGVLGLVLLVGFLLARPIPEEAAAVEGEASAGASAPTVEMVGFDGDTKISILVRSVTTASR